MKVLLTGATGLVGSHIVRHLLSLSNYEILATKRNSSKTDLLADIQDQINWVECDITDVVQLATITKGIDIVIHAAALISFSPRDRKKLYEVNTSGTAHIVDCCLAQGVKKLIYISSVSAYGAARNRLITEDDVWVDKPIKSAYGHSKYLAEREVWRGQAEGLDTVIIAPSIVLGAGFWDAEPAIVQKVADGMKYYPSGTNGIVDARDIAEMIGKVLTSNISGQKFTCSGINIKLEDLINLISESLDARTNASRLKSWVFKIALFYAQLVELLRIKSIIDSESLLISQQDFAYDNTKSIEMLGCNYRNIEDTVSHMSEAFKKSEEDQRDYGIPLRF